MGCPEESHRPTLGKLGHKSVSNGVGTWPRERGLAAPTHLPGLILKEGLLVAWPEADARAFTCNPDCNNPDDEGGAARLRSVLCIWVGDEEIGIPMLEG